MEDTIYKYKIEYVPQSSLLGGVFNTYNIHQHSPYNVKGDIIYIKKSWRRQLTMKTKKALNSLAKKNKMKIEMIDKIDSSELEFHSQNEWKIIDEINRMYYYQFAYNEWYESVKKILPYGITIIPIEEKDRLKLRNTAIMIEMAGYDTSIVQKSISSISKKLVNTIYDAIKVAGGTIFVKTNFTSGKNDSGVIKFHEPTSILTHLVRYPSFKKEWVAPDVSKIKYQPHIIIIPWDHAIKSEGEFRLFITKGELRGISQQKWFEKFPRVLENKDAIIKKIIEWYSKKIKPILYVPDITIDIFLDIDKLGTDEEVDPTFIEYNSGGAYGMAGSSLFEWDKDYEILCGKEWNGITHVKLLNVE